MKMFLQIHSTSSGEGHSCTSTFGEVTFIIAKSWVVINAQSADSGVFMNRPNFLHCCDY